MHRERSEQVLFTLLPRNHERGSSGGLHGHLYTMAKLSRWMTSS
jgi:hypothetical protein